MRVTYIGPNASVDVPALGMVAQHGVPLEIPDDAAERLLEQETNWRSEPKTPRKRASTKEDDD